MANYTDEQIKKALECCVDYEDRCNTECPFFNTDCLGDDRLDKYALDLINRLEAENERLQRVIASITKDRDTEHQCHLRLLGELKTAKSEAIKEFAERLKLECSDHTTDNVNEPCVRILYYADDIIDRVVKEMVGEGE